jgi:hypothetical protein
MRESLLARYLITAIERTNLVTRHLRGEVDSSKKAIPTDQVVNPDKERPSLELLLSLQRALESEVAVLSTEIEKLTNK